MPQSQEKTPEPETELAQSGVESSSESHPGSSSRTLGPGLLHQSTGEARRSGRRVAARIAGSACPRAGHAEGRAGSPRHHPAPNLETIRIVEAVVAEPPVYQCSACGHVHTRPQRFCGMCGASLEAEPKTTETSLTPLSREPMFHSYTNLPVFLRCMNRCLLQTTVFPIFAGFVRKVCLAGNRIRRGAARVMRPRSWPWWRLEFCFTHSGATARSQSRKRSAVRESARQAPCRLQRSRLHLETTSPHSASATTPLKDHSIFLANERPASCATAPELTETASHPAPAATGCRLNRPEAAAETDSSRARSIADVPLAPAPRRLLRRGRAAGSGERLERANGAAGIGAGRRIS